MITIKTKWLSATVSLLLLPRLCMATILVTTNSTTPPNTFSTGVNAKVYDPATGSLYLGLKEASDPYTITRIDRPLGRNPPIVQGIGSGIDQPIANLALVTFTGNNTRSPNIGVPLVAYYTGQSTANQVFALKYDGSLTGSSNALIDATGQPSATASGLTGLAANCAYIFVGAAPNGGAFGMANGGIAVVCVKEHKINGTDNIVLIQTAANQGSQTACAKELDPSTPQVYINAGLQPTIGANAYLFWSDYLERLYIALNIDTTNGGGGKAVVVGQVSNGVLTFSDIAANNAILAAGNVVASSGSVQINIPIVKTMHASTGPSYLIAYGGDTTNVSNALCRISALPLVDNPNDITNQGTLAKYNASLVNHKFVTPAINPNDLATFNQPPVTVGAGPLPAFVAASVPPPTVVNDIEVIGDTVYVAINGVQSSSLDCGVFYSQAQFDATGKISHWTPWTKRAFPYRGFCDASDCAAQTQSFCAPSIECTSNCCQNNGVAFVAVDAVTGKVWAVNGGSQQIVRYTAWDGGSCVSQLPCQLNAALPCGCYSVLDLDQSTIGFSNGNISGGRRNTTEHRYALFGGCDTVVFARVSEAIPSDSIITLTSPQTIMVDFCQTPTGDCCSTSTGKTNFLVTNLLQGTGCVNQLEYSRTTTINFFFAGTNSGLFVFANPDKTGFDVITMTTLDLPPFSTGQWFATPIEDSIVAIKALGNNLYVVTRTVDEGTIICNLYQIPFEADVDSMFDPLPAPIATSGHDTFENVLLFTGLETISDGTTNQLLLSTNQGLSLVSSLTTPPIQFTQVPTGGTTMFAGIGGIDMTKQTTVWPFSVESSFCKTFGTSSIYQMSGPTPTDFIPEFFNASCMTCPFSELYPITYFWSDGARRFFIVNRPCDCPTRNRLMIFPYAIEVWNINTPIDQTLVFDSYIDGVCRFNWIRTIGATGIVMAGVNNGVIALE